MSMRILIRYKELLLSDNLSSNELEELTRIMRNNAKYVAITEFVDDSILESLDYDYKAVMAYAAANLSRLDRFRLLQEMLALDEGDVIHNRLLKYKVTILLDGLELGSCKFSYIKSLFELKAITHTLLFSIVGRKELESLKDISEKNVTDYMIYWD